MTAPLTQTQTLSDAPTDWSNSVTFQQFNGPGMLSSVGIGLTGDLADSLTVQNLNADATTLSAQVIGTVDLITPDNSTLLLSVEPAVSQYVTLAAGQTMAFGTLTNSASSTANLTPGSPLAAFSGNGTVSLPVTATSSLTVYGPANLAITSMAQAGATVSLQYTVNGQVSYGTQTILGGSSSLTGVPILPPFTSMHTPAQTFTFADQTAGWTNSLAVARFDPSQGVLVDVRIAITSDTSGVVQVENLGATSGQFTTTQNTGVILGGLNPAIGTIGAGQTLNDNGNLAALNGSVNDTLTPQATITTSYLTDSIDLSAFTGSGLVTLPISSLGTAYLTAPGSSQVNLSAVDGAVVSISYDYNTAGMACFATGARIATPDGDVPVEALQVGQSIRTVHAGVAAIIWIGQRSIDCTRHPEPARVQPVRVRQHAFGPGLPARDLFLSPDHAVFVDGVLIPIRHLIDGRGIAQVQAARITYFHIELARHDVLFAEGLPAETYLDSGNRADFENGQVVRAWPDFGARRWGAEGCAPFHVAGAVVDMVRARLASHTTIVAESLRAATPPPAPSLVEGRGSFS